jgi:hypothetical protein
MNKIHKSFNDQEYSAAKSPSKITDWKSEKSYNRQQGKLQYTDMQLPAKVNLPNFLAAKTTISRTAIILEKIGSIYLYI